MRSGQVARIAAAILAPALLIGSMIAQTGVATADSSLGGVLAASATTSGGGVEAGDLVFVKQGDYTGNPATGRPSILAVRHGDGTVNDLVTLTDDDNQVNPSVSPDGSRIAFDSRLSGRQTAELYVMNSDASNMKEITTSPADNTASATRFTDWLPSWCGNDTLVFQRIYNSTLLMPGQSTNPEIWTIHADGSGEAKVSQDDTKRYWDPACSPDGTKVAFAGYDSVTGHGQLWYMNSDGSGETLVPNQPEGSDEPVWVSNSRLCFHSLVTNIGNINCIDINGSNLTQVTHSTSGEDAEYPTVSADGSTIAYYQIPGDDIWQTRADGTGTPQNLTAGSGISNVNPAFVNATWRPSCTQAPNPPQEVGNVANGNRGVTVSWDGSVPNCSVIDHYAIHSTTINRDGSVTIGPVVATVPASKTLQFENHFDIGQLALCTFYQYGVSAVAADGQESNVALPPASTFTQGPPDQSPKVVTILALGVATGMNAGSFDPLNVDDYCTTHDGRTLQPRSTAQAPLSDMTGQWINSSDASHTAPYGADSNLVDAAASGGGVVLPFSYSGATLEPGPVFKVSRYYGSTVANMSPAAAAKLMNAEIASIHLRWGQARIVVVGHSNGGLVAEQWWLDYAKKYGKKNPYHIAQVFSLDSPLNGERNTVCTNPVAGLGCKWLVGVGRTLANFYAELWRNQATNDAAAAALDAKDNLFTAVGTNGDPVYDAADHSKGDKYQKIGAVSQFLYPKSCAGTGYTPNCLPVGHWYMNPCGPLNDGSPPYYGLNVIPSLGDAWMHSVVKNCVINEVMKYLN